MTRPKRLSGGNPQIPKAFGDAPVQAYIAAMPGWQQTAGRRLDDIITRTVPAVQKAVKWNTPFYGLDGQTWFLGFHCLTRSVKVAFLRGAALDPQPPGPSRQAEVPYLDIVEAGPFDEDQIIRWILQACLLPGVRL